MLRKLAPAAVSASAVATTESPSSAINSASAWPSDCATVRAGGGAIGAVFFERDDAAALAADRLLERGFDHIAIGIVGQQRREGPLSGAGGVIDDAVDVGLGQEAQEIDAAAGHAGIGRERDDRRRRGRASAARSPEPTAANSGPRMISAPSLERLLGALLRALRAAAIVLDQELDVGILEFRQRHLGGVLHRLRGDAGIAGGRQRQDQADLDLPGADRERLLLRAGGPGVGLRAERIGKLAKALLHAGAGAEQRRAENQADRRPPGLRPTAETRGPCD